MADLPWRRGRVRFSGVGGNKSDGEAGLVPPTLILPVGPPGCGKSLLAQELMEQGLSPQAVISPDQYRMIMTGDRANQHDNASVFAVCHELARARLRNRLTVYFDATNYSALPDFGVMAAAARAKIVCVRFDVPSVELLARNKKRAYPVPSRVLVRMIAEFAAVPLEQYPGTVVTPEEALEGGFV